MTPTTCTDTGQLVDYQVIVDGANGFQVEDMKITVDSVNNVIKMTPLISGQGSITTNTLYPVTIVATMPDRTTQTSFQFSVSDSTCAN